MPRAQTAEEPLLHPLHAILLAFPVAGFTAALFFDIAYLRTAEIQWSNFAAWLISGAELLGTVVLGWAIVIFLRRRHSRSALVYAVLIGVMWLAGLVNAFQHGRDAWSSVGSMGLLLSIMSSLCALAAGWTGHTTLIDRRRS